MSGSGEAAALTTTADARRAAERGQALRGGGEATALTTTADARRAAERGQARRERQYAPRSGGRTAEQRSSTTAEARRYRTQGTAALKPEAAEPLGTTEPAATPRLRVAPPAPISAPRAPFIAVVIVLVVAGVFGILLINTRTNENTFKISKLQDQQAALDNQQQQLENQIAGYESTGNLDAAARRLGLVKADTPAYIRLPDGKVIGVPKPGTGPKAVTAQDPATAGPSGAATLPDGDAQNGVTAGGTGQTVQNGAVQDGTVQGGPLETTQGGNTQGGTTQGGNTQGGNTQGGNTQGGTTQGRTTQGGTDGTTQGGVPQNAGE
jgi:hypothetical protein